MNQRSILLINGHEAWESSPGMLNSTLCEATAKLFTDRGFRVEKSIIDMGFEAEEEVQKFLSVDYILFFTPVYWFGIPAGFKKYLESVFSKGKGRLFKDDGRSIGGKYGTGGLMQSKSYMLITTWNAPESAFNSSTEFLFENKSVDDVFLSFHAAQKFIGLKKMPGIHFHDVKKKPEIDRFLYDLNQHMNFYFNFK